MKLKLNKKETLTIARWYHNSEFDRELFHSLMDKGLIYDNGDCYELTKVGKYINDQLEGDNDDETIDISYEYDLEPEHAHVTKETVLEFLKTNGLGTEDIRPEVNVFDLPRGFAPWYMVKHFGCSEVKMREILKELETSNEICRTGLTKRTKVCVSEFKEQAEQNLLKEQQMKEKHYEETKARLKLPR